MTNNKRGLGAGLCILTGLLSIGWSDSPWLGLAWIALGIVLILYVIRRATAEQQRA